MLKITVNSLDSNLMDYRAYGTMLERYQRQISTRINFAELKTALLTIWNDLSQKFINEAIESFRYRLLLCSWRTF